MAHGVFIAILVSAVWILLHIGFMHIRPAENRIGSMTKGFLISLPMVLIGYQWLPVPDLVRAAAEGETWGIGLFHAYFFHLLIFFLYAECFYHVERAVTSRILVEIIEHKNGAPRVEDIQQEYDTAEMIRQRLYVLRDHRFIEEKEKRWHLQSKGKLFATLMSISSWIYQSKSQREVQQP